MRRKQVLQVRGVNGVGAMVEAVTAGASMWLSVAIGLSAGLGMWPLALLASVMGIVVLWTLRRIQVAAGIKEE